MTNPATYADVEKRFPRAMTSREHEVAATLLDDAWSDLQDEVSDLTDRLADPEVTKAAVRVLAQAVKRVMLNPWGRKQESRGMDDATRSWTVADAIASGALYFTDAELDSVRSGDEDEDPHPRGKAFSVMPS